MVINRDPPGLSSQNEIPVTGAEGSQAALMGPELSSLHVQTCNTVRTEIKRCNVDTEGVLIVYP